VTSMFPLFQEKNVTYIPFICFREKYSFESVRIEWKKKPLDCYEEEAQEQNDNLSHIIFD